MKKTIVSEFNEEDYYLLQEEEEDSTPSSEPIGQAEEYHYVEVADDQIYFTSETEVTTTKPTKTDPSVVDYWYLFEIKDIELTLDANPSQETMDYVIGFNSVATVNIKKDASIQTYGTDNFTLNLSKAENTIFVNWQDEAKITINNFEAEDQILMSSSDFTIDFEDGNTYVKYGDEVAVTVVDFKLTADNII